MKLTSIITVNYNQPVVTMELLHSIAENCKDLAVEVILVDNNPQKNYTTEFHNCFPGLIYIKSDSNLGFAGANNLGFSIAKGQFVLLLNNDTEITEGLIPQLINEMENNNDIGLLSPLIKFFDDKDIIQYAGFTPMNYITARNKGIGFLKKDIGQFSRISEETGFCHGAAVMCRYNDLMKAGFMDESYFLYYEELDWCEKFKSIGKKIWFTGKAVVYHKESITVGKESPMKTYFMTRNRILYIRRNATFAGSLLFCIYYSFVGLPKQIAGYLIKGKYELVKQTVRGLYWNITHSRKSKNLGYEIV